MYVSQIHSSIPVSFANVPYGRPLPLPPPLNLEHHEAYCQVLLGQQSLSPADPQSALSPLLIQLGEFQRSLVQHLLSLNITYFDIHLVKGSAAQAVNGPKSLDFHLWVEVDPSISVGHGGKRIITDFVDQFIQGKLLQLNAHLTRTMHLNQLGICYGRTLKQVGQGWSCQIGPRLTVDFMDRASRPANVSALDSWEVSMMSHNAHCADPNPGLDPIALVQRREFLGSNAPHHFMALLHAVNEGALVCHADWTYAQSQIRDISLPEFKELWATAQMRNSSACAHWIAFLNLLLLVQSEPDLCKKAAVMWQEVHVGPGAHLDFAKLIEKNPELTPHLLAWIHGAFFYSWIHPQQTQTLRAWNFEFCPHPAQQRSYVEFPCEVEPRYLGFAPPNGFGTPGNLVQRYVASREVLKQQGVDVTLFGPILSNLGLRPMHLVPDYTVDEMILNEWPKEPFQSFLKRTFPYPSLIEAPPFLKRRQPDAILVQDAKPVPAPVVAPAPAISVPAKAAPVVHVPPVTMPTVQTKPSPAVILKPKQEVNLPVATVKPKAPTANPWTEVHYPSRRPASNLRPASIREDRVHRLASESIAPAPKAPAAIKSRATANAVPKVTGQLAMAQDLMKALLSQDKLVVPQVVPVVRNPEQERLVEAGICLEEWLTAVKTIDPKNGASERRRLIQQWSVVKQAAELTGHLAMAQQIFDTLSLEYSGDVDNEPPSENKAAPEPVVTASARTVIPKPLKAKRAKLSQKLTEQKIAKAAAQAMSNAAIKAEQQSLKAANKRFDSWVERVRALDGSNPSAVMALIEEWPEIEPAAHAVSQITTAQYTLMAMLCEVSLTVGDDKVLLYLERAIGMAVKDREKLPPFLVAAILKRLTELAPDRYPWSDSLVRCVSKFFKTLQTRITPAQVPQFLDLWKALGSDKVAELSDFLMTKDKKTLLAVLPPASLKQVFAHSTSMAIEPSDNVDMAVKYAQAASGRLQPEFYEKYVEEIAVIIKKKVQPGLSNVAQVAEVNASLITMNRWLPLYSGLNQDQARKLVQILIQSALRIEKAETSRLITQLQETAKKHDIIISITPQKFKMSELISKVQSTSDEVNQTTVLVCLEHLSRNTVFTSSTDVQQLLTSHFNYLLGLLHHVNRSRIKGVNRAALLNQFVNNQWKTLVAKCVEYGHYQAAWQSSYLACLHLLYRPICHRARNAAVKASNHTTTQREFEVRLSDEVLGLAPSFNSLTNDEKVQVFKGILDVLAMKHTNEEHRVMESYELIEDLAPIVVQLAGYQRDILTKIPYVSLIASTRKLLAITQDIWPKYTTGTTIQLALIINLLGGSPETKV